MNLLFLPSPQTSQCNFNVANHQTFTLCHLLILKNTVNNGLAHKKKCRIKVYHSINTTQSAITKKNTNKNLWITVNKHQHWIKSSLSVSVKIIRSKTNNACITKKILALNMQVPKRKKNNLETSRWHVGHLPKMAANSLQVKGVCFTYQ